MSITEDKIVKIVDTSTHSRGVSVEQIGSQGALITKLASGMLVNESYNSIELTYVTVGDGIGEIATVVYKKAGDTVATLTLAYDSNDKLSSVTKT